MTGTPSWRFSWESLSQITVLNLKFIKPSRSGYARCAVVLGWRRVSGG